jgi:hypothetical protein
MNMKHRNTIFLAIAVVVLLSQTVIVGMASADSATVNGWTNQGQSGLFDFYITPNQQVNPTELSLIVNYEDTLITVEVLESNRTVFSQIIDPHSSAFLTLTFPDVQTGYKIVIQSGGFTLLTITKAAPGYYLPTQTDDSTWHIAPPAPNSALKYTEAAVQSLLAELTLTTVLIAILVIMFGVIVGALVKQITRFLVPTDFISIILCAVVLLDIIFNFLPTGTNKIWNVAWFAGYQIGFWLWRIDYLTPIKTVLKEKTITFLPIPYYYPDDGSGCCLATQTNGALFKRLFLHIHHRLGTDAGIAQDWQTVGKKPYLPKIHVRALWVEKEVITEEKVKWWIFTLSKFQTEYKLAYASGIQKAQWLVNGKAYFTIQDMYERLALRYTEMRLTHRLEAVGSSAAMVEASARVGPGERFKQFWGQEPAPIDLEIGETVLNVIEAVEVEPQEGADEYPEEQQEQEDDRKQERRTSGNKPIKRNNSNGNRRQNARQRNDNDNEED